MFLSIRIEFPHQNFWTCRNNPYYVVTRVLPNWRPTTRECVHTVHSVTHGHFRSRDIDSGRTIRSVIAENPMVHSNLMAISSIEPELWAIEFDIAGIGIFDILASVTLTFTRWPSYTNVTCIPWRHTGFANMQFLYVRISKIIVWQTYIFRVAQKGTIFDALTLPNIHRFSKLYYCQNREKIGNNTITKDPTTPPVSYTHLTLPTNREV